MDQAHLQRATVGVSALVTAFERPAKTLATIERILACEPAPREVLVHVDGGREDIAQAIADRFPRVKLHASQSRVGAGGGRNVLLESATCDLCASFDDDSFPLSRDFFAAAAAAFDRFPDAWVIAAHVKEASNKDSSLAAGTARVGHFLGGACIFRRSAILGVGRFVPLQIAYGMEELDLSFRLHALGGRVIYVPELRVFHDSDLAHRKEPTIVAFSLCNVGLHCALRYPVMLWPLGIAQVIRAIIWDIGHGQSGGIRRGLALMPGYIWSRRLLRRSVPTKAVISFIRLKRHPILASSD